MTDDCELLEPATKGPTMNTRRHIINWTIGCLIGAAIWTALASPAFSEGGWECPPGTVLSFVEQPPSQWIDGDTYTVPPIPAITLLAIKAGTVHHVFGDGSTSLAGAVLTVPTGKDISHVDNCKPVTPPPPTSPPPTTSPPTTVPPPPTTSPPPPTTSTPPPCLPTEELQNGRCVPTTTPTTSSTTPPPPTTEPCPTWHEVIDGECVPPEITTTVPPDTTSIPPHPTLPVTGSSSGVTWTAFLAGLVAVLAGWVTTGLARRRL